MPRTIDAKTRVSAVKDYVTSGDPLRVVSERHGISSETLRRFLGDKVRKALKGRPVTKSKGVMSIPFPSVRKRSGKDATRPNANRRWSHSEDELLRDAVLGNFTVEETVDLLGRTGAAITTRKHILLENGFINEKRFKTPEGITRTRRTQEEIERDLQNSFSADSVAVSPEETMSSPVTAIPSLTVEGPTLRELAEIVKDFGVNINMTVTQGGTVIKIHN
jgi:transposase-like protein